MIKSEDSRTERREVEIEKRLNAASAKRENIFISKSASKKRTLSPRPSPTNKPDRIDHANSRREIFLSSRVEKAKNSKNSPKVNKTLFAALSPKRKESPLRASSRIKAARLGESKVIHTFGSVHFHFFECSNLFSVLSIHFSV